MLNALLVILAAAVTSDAECACPVDETTMAKVERLRAELDAALTQLRLERAAKRVNDEMRKRAKR